MVNIQVKQIEAKKKIDKLANIPFKDYLSEEEMLKIHLGVSERIKRAKFVNFEKEKVKLEKEIIAMRDKK